MVYDFSKDDRFKGIQHIEGKCLLSSPTIHGDEERYVHEAFASGWVTTAGESIDRLEEELASYLGIDHAVALSSGTAALHLAIKLAGEKLYGQPKPGHGTLEGRKVFCSDMTFDATVNPVSYENGECVFIDTEEQTWNMDPCSFERAFALYPETRLIILVHLYGTPGKIEEIRSIADAHGALIVEDAAESLGATYTVSSCTTLAQRLGKSGSVQTGTFGDYGVVSFNGNNVFKTVSLFAQREQSEDLMRICPELAA